MKYRGYNGMDIQIWQDNHKMDTLREWNLIRIVPGLNVP